MSETDGCPIFAPARCGWNRADASLPEQVPKFDFIEDGFAGELDLVLDEEDLRVPPITTTVCRTKQILIGPT